MREEVREIGEVEEVVRGVQQMGEEEGQEEGEGLQRQAGGGERGVAGAVAEAKGAMDREERVFAE